VRETSEGKRKSRVCRQHFQDHSLSTVSLAVLAGWVHGQISFGVALSVEKSGGMEPARGKGQTPANSSKPLSFGQTPQCPVFVSTPFHHKMRSIGYHRFTIPKSKSHPLAAFLHGLRDSTCSKQETTIFALFENLNAFRTGILEIKACWMDWIRSNITDMRWHDVGTSLEHHWNVVGTSLERACHLEQSAPVSSRLVESCRPQPHLGFGVS
jgi:hypothetical protein